MTFRDRFFTPKVARAMMSPLGIVLAGAGAAGGDRRRAADRRRGRASVPWRGAAGSWPSLPKDAPSARVAPSTPERTVAVLRHPGRGVQAALRPGRRVGRRRGRCATGWLSCRVASTRASTSRGASPAAVTRSSTPSVRSTPRRPRPNGPSCGAPSAGGSRRRRRPRRCRPSRPSWHRPTGWPGSPTAAATGCACSTPASTSSSPERSR